MEKKRSTVLRSPCHGKEYQPTNQPTTWQILSTASPCRNIFVLFCFFSHLNWYLENVHSLNALRRDGQSPGISFWLKKKKKDPYKGCYTDRAKCFEGSSCCFWKNQVTLKLHLWRDQHTSNTGNSFYLDVTVYSGLLLMTFECVYSFLRRALTNTQCYLIKKLKYSLFKKMRKNALKQPAIPNKIFLLP